MSLLRVLGPRVKRISHGGGTEQRVTRTLLRASSPSELKGTVMAIIGRIYWVLRTARFYVF